MTPQRVAYKIFRLMHYTNCKILPNCINLTVSIRS